MIPYEELEKLFSTNRLDSYFKLFPENKQKAIQYYQLNTQIAESFYPLLSNLEVALRNSIHNSFKVHYHNDNWFSHLEYKELVDQVNIANSKINAASNRITPDKLVSELTLGFWTSLLNKQYAKEFWKPLMYVFPLVDKQNKKRNKISYKLNQIRKFRNRIFHYEPICNDLTLLVNNHNIIIEVLGWFSPELVHWTKEIDRFNILYNEAYLFRQH